jgi:hypothetical protein
MSERKTAETGRDGVPAVLDLVREDWDAEDGIPSPSAFIGRL